MSETNNASPYMTTNELALLIRKKRQDIWAMRTRGTAPKGTRIGRQVLFHRDDVQEWLQAKELADPLHQLAASAA
jgi:excisionase family DNA binding protein